MKSCDGDAEVLEACILNTVKHYRMSFILQLDCTAFTLTTYYLCITTCTTTTTTTTTIINNYNYCHCLLSLFLPSLIAFSSSLFASMFAFIIFFNLVLLLFRIFIPTVIHHLVKILGVFPLR